VASTRSELLEAVYSTFVIFTVSAAAATFIVRVAERVTPPPVAEITTLVVAVTVFVVTVKLALVAPAGTVTVAGTVAAVLLLASVTTSPPEEAGEVRVTVPVEELPPVTLEGFRLPLDTVAAAAAGFTAKVADRVTTPAIAEIATAVDAVTTFVVTVKLALVAPAATVTLAGLRLTVDNAGAVADGFTVSTALWVMPPYEAMMLAAIGTDTL
jgi:hypothetical protein